MNSFGIVGALGRMGRTIATLSAAESDLKLQAAFEYAAHPQLGLSMAEATGVASLQVVTEALNGQAFSRLRGVIDFSSPEASLQTLKLAVEHNTAVVLGTTGWNEAQLAEVKKAAEKIPVLLSSNMSVGVNTLFALVNAAARILIEKGFDPEITEIHHNLKKDSPSGTARSLEQIVLEAAGWSKEQSVYGREGLIGERPAKELGVMALRGGDVVGEHTVYFLGQGERVELKHLATSRDIFARGSLTALKFLLGQKKGLYNMQDALNLKF